MGDDSDVTKAFIIERKKTKPNQRMKMKVLFAFLLVFCGCANAFQRVFGRSVTHKSSLVRATSPTILYASQDAKSVNIQLDNIKNMRDIASSSVTSIKPGIIYRTGCVSKASDNDIQLCNNLKVKTWIDLRSEAELHEDENLHSNKVYNDFKSFTYDKKIGQFKPLDKDTKLSHSDKRRYFISLMSESLIKKGVFFRLQKRLRFKSIFLLMLANISRRAEKRVRSIFIESINKGGLGLLNELVLDYSSKEIIEVLKLLTNIDNHPVGVFCTAGKDRTGLITMLTLSVLGVPDDEILADYVLSDSAYSEINDKKAMVASLKQVDVDPEIFLRAKPQVMKDTIAYIRNNFGSINNYLDAYGFDENWRNKLRIALHL